MIEHWLTQIFSWQLGKRVWEWRKQSCMRYKVLRCTFLNTKHFLQYCCGSYIRLHFLGDKFCFKKIRIQVLCKLFREWISLLYFLWSLSLKLHFDTYSNTQPRINIFFLIHLTVNHPKDLIGNSSYHLACSSFDVSLENLVLNQLTIP